MRIVREKGTGTTDATRVLQFMLNRAVEPVPISLPTLANNLVASIVHGLLEVLVQPMAVSCVFERRQASV